MLPRSARIALSDLTRILTYTLSAHLLTISLFAQPATTQGARIPVKGATPPTMIPRFPDDRASIVKGPMTPEQRIEEGCFLPPLTMSTVPSYSLPT